MSAPPLRAILFDMDGTLVDTEEQTDVAIREVLRRRGVADAALPPYETRGRTWDDVAAALLARYSVALSPRALVDELVAAWAEATAKVQPIPGARAAVHAAAQLFHVAVVSSSPRALIDRILTQIDVAAIVPPEARIGAEHVTHPKPAPDGFLLASARLGAEPGACVVFEDSRAGLEAARAAGMHSVLVSHRCAEPEACRALATTTCEHYDALPEGFWQRLHADGAVALRER